LAGLLGVNQADPAAQGVALDVGIPDTDPNKPITFEIESVINMSQTGGDNNGAFTPDDQMPGIPGTTGGMDGIAGEITTYIELTAGMHTLIVNSDDGFRTTTGNINDILIPAAGEFSGGRGAADTQYQVYASATGVYPFRTVWQEGGGGANIEWKEVLADKTVVLINDDANGGPKAYRAVTKGLDAPSIVAVTPAVNARVGTATGLEVDIKLGSVAIDAGSVQLSLDDVAVTPSVTTAAGIVTVKGQPAALAVGKHTAKVRFTYGGAERIATWDFNAFTATLDTVHKYPGLVLGSAVYGNGHSGKPGDYAMNMGLQGGPVLVNDGSFVNVGASKDQLTVAFWGKKLENNDSSAFWLNSPSSNNGQRGFQSHLPWSNGHIYFDTAGCCNGDQRIEQVVDGTTVADYSGTWWQNWHHFAYTKNADVKQIWIDGKLFLEGTGAAPLPVDFTSLTIGSIGDLSGLFHGSIDDFSLFSTALTEADINLLVAGTKPTALPAADELLAVWEFNDFGDPEGAFISFAADYNMVHIVHLQGSRSWDLSKVSLAVDGKPTGVVATRNGSEVTVHFVPSPIYAPKSAHTASLSYPGPTGDLVVKSWDFTTSDYVKDTVHQYIGLFKGTTVLTDDKGGHTGAAGDRAVDFGKSGNNYVLNEDASWLNPAAANDTVTVSFWAKKYSNNDASAFWIDSPSSPATQRGFQAHLPWSNGHIYFDTAGCCNGGETRIEQMVDDTTVPSYTATWWNDWHNFVFVKNAAVKQIWIDGALFLDGAGTTPLFADFTRLWIGGIGGGPAGSPGNNMRGVVDDFAVFGSGLADTDIAKLFAGTRPTALGATANLLALWEFNDAPVVVQDPPKFTKIANNGNGTVTVEWTGGGLLQYAGAVTGPWIDATGATSPYTFTPPAAVVFGRIKR